MKDQKISRIDGEYIDLYDFYGHLLGRKPTKSEMDDFQHHRQRLDLSTEATCMLLVSLANQARHRELVATAMSGVAQKAAKLALQGMRPLIIAEFRRFEKRLWPYLVGFLIIALAIIAWAKL